MEFISTGFDGIEKILGTRLEGTREVLDGDVQQIYAVSRHVRFSIIYMSIYIYIHIHALKIQEK